MGESRIDLSNYIPVPVRLNAFYQDKFPEGRLVASAPSIVEVPSSAHAIVDAVVGKLGRKASGVSTKEVIEALEEALKWYGPLPPKVFVEVSASAWRSPDDQVPARATAWEPFPGSTNYTRDAEMMNAETSALGRVLAMCGVEVQADIASANEVRARQEAAAERAEDVNPEAPVGAAQGMFFIRFAKNQRGLTDEEIEALVLETTEGRTAEVGGVLVSEWGRLRDLAADFYRQRSGMRPLPPAGATPDGSGQVQDAGPDVRVLDVPVQVADEGLKTPAELGSRKRGK